MREATPLFDRCPALSEAYEQGPRWFVPGYDASHAMAAVLLRDRIGDAGRILVLGAGGGVELSVFARESADWRFVAVDPSVEMLGKARRRLAEEHAEDRVEWIQGGIEAAPNVRFDAATAFLVLHFVPDDGRRLALLRELHSRLAPGAPFLVIDSCADVRSPRFAEDLRLYCAYARRSGAPAEIVAGAVEMVRTEAAMVPPEREEALLLEAGFRDLRRFYTGLWFHGWVATAVA